MLFSRASSSTLKGEAPRRGAISMHLGAFSAGNQIFAAGEPLCCCQWCQALGAGRSDARLSDVGPFCQGPALGWTLPWPAGCRLLGAAVGSAFGSALCELAPGEALGDCPSAELSGRVSHRQGGRWRSGLRGHGSHFRLLLLVSGARSLPERTCNRTFACKDASACFVPLVSWSSWGVLREAFLTGSSAGASFQAVVGWEAYPKLSDAT